MQMLDAIGDFEDGVGGGLDDVGGYGLPAQFTAFVDHADCRLALRVTTFAECADVEFIDGKVVHAGGVPSRDKIAAWFAA